MAGCLGLSGWDRVGLPTFHPPASPLLMPALTVRARFPFLLCHQPADCVLFCSFVSQDRGAPQQGWKAYLKKAGLGKMAKRLVIWTVSGLLREGQMTRQSLMEGKVGAR